MPKKKIAIRGLKKFKELNLDYAEEVRTYLERILKRKFADQIRQVRTDTQGYAEVRKSTQGYAKIRVDTQPANKPSPKTKKQPETQKTKKCT